MKSLSKEKSKTKRNLGQIIKGEMGSLKNATYERFICLVCHEASQIVILIHGSRGQREQIYHKMIRCNYPSPSHHNGIPCPPQTICLTCARKLDMLYLYTKAYGKLKNTRFTSTRISKSYRKEANYRRLVVQRIEFPSSTYY